MSINNAYLAAEMSRLTIPSDENESHISRLEALPQELRMEILRYVLHTKYARLPRPERTSANNTISHMRAFDWNVSILRVCKTLHNDGSDILNRENKWIKLIFHWDANFLYTSLNNYDLVTIKQSTATNIGNHLAVVTIGRVGDPVKKLQGGETLLLPLEELGIFVNYLQSMDVMNFIGCRFVFDLPQKLSKSLQRQILQPFASIQGELSQQIVDIAGHVDPSIAKKVSGAMTERVCWLRAKGWDTQLVFESLKDAADDAFVAKEYNIASHKYGQACHSWEAAIRSYPQLDRLDPHLKTHRWIFDTVCSTMSMLSLNLAGRAASSMNDLESLQSWMRDPRMLGVPTALMAMMVYVGGVGQMTLRKPKLAIPVFQYGMRLCSPEQKPMLEKAILGAETFGSKTSSDRASEIARLLTTLGSKPLSTPEKQPYVCDVAASEKYICKRLGLSRFPERHTSIIREGISIRHVDINGDPGDLLKVFATEGRKHFTHADIDLLEVLLYERLNFQWRARSSNIRGAAPRLCQVGHVIPEMLDPAVLEFQEGTAGATAKIGQLAAETQRQIAGPRIWIYLNPLEIGSRSVSEDADLRESVLAEWKTRTPAQKAKFERIVDDVTKRQ